MRKAVRTAALAAVAAVALAAGVYFALERRAGAVDPAAMSALTRKALPDLAGGETSLERWQGKVLVVNFWASWCPPCREEIPGLIRIQQRFAANGVQLVAGFEAVDLTRKLGNPIGALPYTLVLDRKGTVIRTHLGILSETDLERILAPLLG
jgi:thiol-disulfide isomerase/thioredoxin